MNAAARLIGFAALLAVLFAAAYAVGAAVGTDSDRPPASGQNEHALTAPFTLAVDR